MIYFTLMNQAFLRDIIVNVITKVLDLNLKVIAEVFDEGTSNMTFVKKKEFLKNLFLEVKNTFFLFDVSHNFKNVSNNLLKNNFMYKDNEGSFKDIKDTYEIDKCN